jgi:hypothetical protein
MVQMLVIALIVALVALRLSIPPVPGLLKTGLKRWGTRTTVLLCSVSLFGAAAVIILSRRS